MNEGANVKNLSDEELETFREELNRLLKKHFESDEVPHHIVVWDQQKDGVHTYWSTNNFAEAV